MWAGTYALSGIVCRQYGPGGNMRAGRSCRRCRQTGSGADPRCIRHRTRPCSAEHGLIADALEMESVRAFGQAEVDGVTVVVRPGAVQELDLPAVVPRRGIACAGALPG